MEITTERAMAYLFGLIGGLLIGLGGLFAMSIGLAELVVGHLTGAAAGISEAIILFVVGALILVFAHMGEHAWRDRPSTSGVLLVILAVVAWSGLGLGSNVIVLVGGLFAVLAGVLYLIEPAKRAASALAAAA